VWLELKGKIISFWHDIPLYPVPSNKQIISFYVEIPRWTDAKIETKRDEPMNPIFHDTKSKKPRYVESVWPHKTYPIVYGSVPQTWEDPTVKDPITGLEGDKDPIDLFDIGIDPGYVGQVRQVKILGGIGLVDDGATDWKLIGIDMNDTIASKVNSLADVEKYRPGVAKDMFEWFKYYKVARGNPVNTIVGDDYWPVQDMVDLVDKSHGYWGDMIKGLKKAGDINYNQTMTPSANVSYVPACGTAKKFNIPTQNILPAVPKPVEYTWWYYLDSNYKLISQ
jgi:inorganic pyrophosphatase